ncbi:MAG: hypothetical protein IKK82_14660, partial [Kiritimatiellae bacterium]|nr:hypothetical protein [Kiritimatiellia bacterium]
MVVSVERASPRGYAIFIFVRLGGGESFFQDRRIPSLDVKYYSKIILFVYTPSLFNFLVAGETP